MSATETAQLQAYITNLLRAAKSSAPSLAVASTTEKNEAIRKMASSIWSQRETILRQNELDITSAEKSGESKSRLDRLRLTPDRMKQMVNSLNQLADLADPVGDVLDQRILDNGLKIRRVRVPLGVVAMIYESRPNVTVDAAALALKTGNAVVLRGGKEAMKSNQAIVAALRAGILSSGLPVSCVELVEVEDRASIDVIIESRGLVDLVIPRGGAGLINRVVESSKVPVIETGTGICHVYVDAEADVVKASNIVINAKTSRPSVCNAMETLLVHEDIARAWLPDVIEKLIEVGVEIRGCDRTRQALSSAPRLAQSIIHATEEDYATEYLDLTMAVKVVDSVEDALVHIYEHGTLHSECIVTENSETAQTFLTNVDAAAVYHNASTRFTDGFEFGFGAEIGISTQKLHARGPMGLEALTSYKYIVEGDGQIRP